MRRIAVSLLFACLLVPSISLAAKPEKKEAPRWGVVLAVFGSTHKGGMAGAEKIKARLEAALPGVPVRLGLTSRHALSGLKGQSVLSAMAQLSDEGYRHLVVEPLHVSAGSEYRDVAILTKALRQVATSQAHKKPFEAVILGSSALGAARDGDPGAMAQLARALAADAREAKDKDAALVYGAHGNPGYPATEIVAFQKVMAKTYPGLAVAVSTLESRPGYEEAAKTVRQSGKKNVLLLPLLYGAGVHAADDLCGSEKDSWKSQLEKAGYQVDCRMRGLGEVDAVADMVVDRVRAALNRGR